MPMSTSVILVSTWNQHCGIAKVSEQLLEHVPFNDRIVLSEFNQTVVKADEPFVYRCWSRENSDYSQLEQQIERFSPSTVLLNIQEPGFFKHPPFSEMMKRLQKKGKQFIAYLHSTFTLNKRYESFYRALDGAIVHSEESRLEVIANGVVPDRAFVVDHGITTLDKGIVETREKTRNALNIKENEKLVISFGFLQPHKGMETVIEAVASVNAKGIATRAIIAGGVNASDPNSLRYANALREIVQVNNLSPVITFEDGYVSDERINTLLAAADAVILNYRSEHYEWSGVASRAVGAGVPTITSLAPAFSAFKGAVWHATAGFPVPLALEVVLTDQNVRDELIRSAQNFSLSRSWSITWNRFKEVFEAVSSVSESTLSVDPPFGSYANIGSSSVNSGSDSGQLSALDELTSKDTLELLL